MRIGDVLVEQRKLRQSELTRALAEKPTDTRLCSYLVAKGLVEFDDAARALGEQKRVACALAKHLAGRDHELAKLIPAELGRSSCALPIGRSSSGALIIAVRDPAPALLTALERATKAQITMVITVAQRLENLVAEAYGEAPVEEFDVDFSSSVEIPPPGDDPPPPLPDMDALDPESVRLSLTDLDDVRVDKDFSQNGIPIPGSNNRPSTLPPANKVRNTDPKATRPMSVEMMQIGLEHATTREAATDLVLAYVATRWLTGLVLAVRGQDAIGYRGHGVIAPESITLPLASPSTVARAVETRFVSVHTPDGISQQLLARALDGPTNPAAAPVIVNGQPAAVLVVGDPVAGATDLESASADLAMLSEALGAAYQRIMGR